MERKMWVFVFALFWALTSHAQVTTGTIAGTVTDSTGAVMPGVRMVIQNEDTGISRSVTTDAAGRYGAPSLGLGNYRVTASMEGFQTEVRRGIVLTVGREAVVNMQLAVGAVAQTVEVTGEAPLVETTEAAVSYLVNDRTVRELPLNGRDLTQLVLLNPGVNQAVNAAGTSAFQGWGKQISISGARSEDSAYLLDGSYINDMNHHIPAGPSGALLGVETVREFQVLTNSFGAQYGRTMGGVLNAVSKSGTNEWHGTVYEFLRNSALDARNFFDRDPANPTVRSEPPPFKRNQFGGTVGGPIQKDKAFFFVAYEGMRERLSETRSNVVMDANARLGILPTGTVSVSDKVKPFLVLFPLPTPGGRNFGDGTAEFIFTASQPTQDDFGQGRVDYQFSDSDSLFGRFTGSNSKQPRVLSYPGFLQLPYMQTRLFTLSETHIFSPRMLLRTLFSFNRVVPGSDAVRPTVPPSLESVPGEGPPDLSPGSGITGVSGFGTPGEYYVTNRFSPQADINLTLGGHGLQFGGMAERLQFNQDFTNRVFGVWTFGSLAGFLAGTTTRYRGTPRQFGDPTVGARQWFFALYLQDDWKVTPKLTLNLGLRWEPYTVATEVNGKLANQRHLLDSFLALGDPFWINRSWRDLGPRFGLAWTPFAGGNTAVRGGFGITFLPNDPNVYRNEMGRNSVVYPELNFPSTGKFPDALAEIAAYRQTGAVGQTPAISYDNFKTPRVLQYNLNVQQQIGSASVVAAGFTGARGINQTSFSDYNAPLAVYDGVSLAYPVGAARFNQKFDAIHYTASNVNSWYNALTLSVQRRFAAGFQTQLAYTFSKSLSISETAQLAEYSGAGSGPLLYAHDTITSKSLSGFHVAHTFSVNYSYALPFGRGMTGVAGHLFSGWQLTGIVSAQSGQPFAISRTTPTAIVPITAASLHPNRDLSVPKDRIILGGPDQYFNPLAFSAPTTRQLGNFGRNGVLAPGQAKWDVGVTKDTGLTEQLRLQFRAEAFNVTNRANFGKPSSNLFTAGGGRVGSAGQITSTVGDSRQLQLSLKLLF